MSSTKPSVDVIIPTLNGGERFKELLKCLNSQDYQGNLGIIIVDSGSSDDTCGEARKYDNTKVFSIDKKSFSHSYARNLGAEKSEADILLFMTQDAVPRDKSFVSKLTAQLAKGFAAVSCREDTSECPGLFYKVSSMFYQKDIGIYGTDRICVYHEGQSTDEIRRNSALNDVSNCISRELFFKYRYEGDYAEDLLLGKKLIEDGHKLMLLGTTTVSHYHDRTPVYYLKRQYVETKTLDKILQKNPEKLSPAKGHWIICQSVGTMAMAFEKIKAFPLIQSLLKSSKGILIYLTLLRQLLKILEKRPLNSGIDIEISREMDLSGLIKASLLEYDFANRPKSRNPIMDIRGFMKYGLEPYIKDNKLTPNIEEIKACLYCELGREIGYYLAEVEPEMDIMKHIWGSI